MELRTTRQDLFDALHHSIGERAIGRHAHVSQSTIPVVQLDNLGQILPEDRLAASGEQKEQLAHAASHAVNLVKTKLVRLSSRTLLVKKVETMTATQIANLCNKMNEINRHRILFEEYFSGVPDGLKSFPKVHRIVLTILIFCYGQRAPARISKS